MINFITAGQRRQEALVTSLCLVFSSNTANAMSLRYQNNIKHLVPDSSPGPRLFQSSPNSNTALQPSIFPSPPCEYPSCRG
ncbi:hypothetical protein F2P81_006517 [Scophthalmus maximus]|uniref:Uncharacterized protein n=1 Tax=Scophthalmus maximus TaxID=52904 RepID=A0A6A4T6W6_SCOMX|nr:hypothetical protein F2P81_006517 [Scophthalmus maximus]